MATFSLMTYNIRNMKSDRGTAADWDNRRESLAGLISTRSPDALCVQEAYAPQIDFLAQALSGYDYAGVGRDDGAREGEYSAVFWKRSRFELRSAKTFWLSETPDIPSFGWDAHQRRICTAAHLLEDDGRALCVASLHLDHAGEEARRGGARLLRSVFSALAPTEQCFVAGDYNAEPDSEPYRIMNAPPFSDARLSACEYADFATFVGFNGEYFLSDSGPIDHCFTTPGPYRPRTADILAVKRGGGYPSDHFPLLITFAD